MNIIRISWKNLTANKMTLFLNILLISFGIGILTTLLLAADQIKNKLRDNAKDIDLVVGAKGSPLQLILSSIYYIDFPTGNISVSEAEELARNPMVKRAVPLALGDNYKGFRIVGSDTAFINLYDLNLATGTFWDEDFEVTLGAQVAAQLELKSGDTFAGSHGFTPGQETHEHHVYKVTGILAPLGNVADHLILTSVASIWKMHHDDDDIVAADHPMEKNPVKEITSLLIQYESPTSIVFFPRMVNETTNMQAASPALESGRLFSLIGIGFDTLEWFALLIMAIAGISIWVSLYNALKERKPDLALMRVMGVSKISLFTLILMEALILTMIGGVVGIILGHLVLEIIGHAQNSSQVVVTGFKFLSNEIALLFAALLLGFVAALLPAVNAYRTDIAKSL